MTRSTERLRRSKLLRLFGALKSSPARLPVHRIVRFKNRIAVCQMDGNSLRFTYGSVLLGTIDAHRRPVTAIDHVLGFNLDEAIDSAANNEGRPADPEGTPLLVSCGKDRTLRVWDLRTGTQKGQTIHLPKEPAVVAASFGGSLAAVGYTDGTLQAWVLNSGDPLQSPVPLHDQPSHLAFIGGTIIVATKSGLLSVEHKSDRIQASQGLLSAITCLAPFPGYQDRFVCGFSNGNIEVRNTQLQLIKRLPARAIAISKLAFLDRDLLHNKQILYSWSRSHARALLVYTEKNPRYYDGWIIPPDMTQDPWESFPDGITDFKPAADPTTNPFENMPRGTTPPLAAKRHATLAFFAKIFVRLIGIGIIAAPLVVTSVVALSPPGGFRNPILIFIYSHRFWLMGLPLVLICLNAYSNQAKTSIAALLNKYVWRRQRTWDGWARRPVVIPSTTPPRPGGTTQKAVYRHPASFVPNSAATLKAPGPCRLPSGLTARVIDSTYPIVVLGTVEIPLKEFLVVAQYIMTETDLRGNESDGIDPRFRFKSAIESLVQQEGLSTGAKRFTLPPA
jgi:hypothetical protein